LINWLYFPLVFLLRKLLGVKEHKPSDARDELEFNLLNQAVEKGIPVLGICRGAQLINIYFKGSLYEDINKFYFEEPNRHSIFPVKTIFLKEGSKLKEILKLDELKVNALHNQAVKEKGEDIVISAKEPNEIVQGIEHQKQDFIIGVQWHPEYLVNQSRHRRLFKTLIEHS
jgi:putative glutamine amidotransferase